MVETWIQDVRFAFRLLRRSPVFTLTAALSLAIGIGANTTIFSVASALLLRPLPGLSAPDRLVDIGRTRHGQGFDTSSYPNYLDLRQRTTTLSGVYAYRGEPQAMSLAGSDSAESVYGASVTGNYFAVLGTQPAAGRFFTDADDKPGRNAVTVLSYELWQRRFGADPQIVGRTITLTSQSYMVIGVAPRGFQGTTLLRSDLWVPLSVQASGPGNVNMFTNRRIVWLLMGGRLKPGVTVQQADAEARAIGETLGREYRENEDRGFRVARSAVIPGRINFVATFIGLLMGIVGLVLLIACVNVAGMLLARAATRQREIAVRLAIGAGRGRLVRQLLTESVMLFGSGCAVGLVISQWLTALLLALLPQLPMPVGIEMTLDWRALTATIAVTLVAAVLSGLVPALQASSPQLVPALRREGLDHPARLRLRNAFVAGQITLSLLLVIAAALFLRALGHATSIQPGFDQAGVDVASIDLALAGYKDQTGLEFARALVDRARALPGASSVVLATDLPLDGSRMSFGNLRPPGSGETRFDGPPVDWNVVTPGFFKTMGVRLLRGRDFSDADGPGAARVAIVNEALSRRYWGSEDPIGRQLEVVTPMSPQSALMTVVGVAANAQFVSLGDTESAYVYVPLAQQYRSQVSLMVKSASGTMIPQIRALVREMNPNLPVTLAMPLSEVTAIGLVPQRIAAAVAGSLGIVGLLLAAIGIYGVTSYAVSRRTHEIGIRIALGADRGGVLRLVLRQALVLTAIGVGIGVIGAVALSQLLRSLLFGISSVDPIAFGGAVALLALTALTASYIPARRAARVDPMVALRAE